MSLRLITARLTWRALRGRGVAYKRYVGQTKRNIKARLGEHMYGIKRQKAFHTISTLMDIKEEKK